MQTTETLLRESRTTDESVTLHSLRDLVRSNRISRTSFLVSTAALYHANALPLRCAAILSLIDETALSAEELTVYYALRAGNDTATPPSEKCCSLIMIVKNEEHTIRAALDSVDGIMDEIVICDTGSTDNTIAEAEYYGARIIHDPWQNDFSRARNKAIDASTGDWIFWMDADDRLDNASCRYLRELWRHAEPQGAAFCISNVRKNATAIDFIQVRLFPRLPGIRFEQRIHEQIMYSIARHNIPFQRHPAIRIIHHGYYDSELHTQKALRNKPLIHDEIMNNPDDPTLLLSYADCCMALKQQSEAEEYYMRVINNEKAWKINSDVFVQAHINYAKICIKNNDIHNAKRYFLRSLYLDETRIESWYALGRLFFDEGNREKAAWFFIKSARIKPPLRLTAVDNLHIRLESIYYLAELLLAWKRFDEARHMLTSSIQCYPMVPRYYTQLGQLEYAQNNLAQAAGYFTASIVLSPAQNNDAYEGMAAIYAKIGDYASAENYRCKIS